MLQNIVAASVTATMSASNSHALAMRNNHICAGVLKNKVYPERTVEGSCGGSALIDAESRDRDTAQAAGNHFM